MQELQATIHETCQPFEAHAAREIQDLGVATALIVADCCDRWSLGQRIQKWGGVCGVCSGSPRAVNSRSKKVQEQAGPRLSLCPLQGTTNERSICLQANVGSQFQKSAATCTARPLSSSRSLMEASKERVLVTAMIPTEASPKPRGGKKRSMNTRITSVRSPRSPCGVPQAVLVHGIAELPPQRLGQQPARQARSGQQVHGELLALWLHVCILLRCSGHLASWLNMVKVMGLSKLPTGDTRVDWTKSTEHPSRRK